MNGIEELGVTLRSLGAAFEASAEECEADTDWRICRAECESAAARGGDGGCRVVSR